MRKYPPPKYTTLIINTLTTKACRTGLRRGELFFQQRHFYGANGYETEQNTRRGSR